MKRFIILFCCLPFVMQAARRNPFDISQEVNGPVKSVSIAWFAGQNVSLYYGKNRVGKSQEMRYYDQHGREIKTETIHRGKTDDYTITTYDDSSFVSVSKSYNAKNQSNDYYEVTYFNERWSPVCDFQYHKDTIQHRDSTVYNQWDKIAIAFHSHGKEPYYRSEAYKYDSIGTLLGMREFDSNGKMIGGFDVHYSDTIVQLHFFGQTYYSHYRDKSDDGPDSWTIKYYYNKQHQLIRREMLKSMDLFTKYDDYGNWLVCESHTYYGLNEYIVTAVREISYWDMDL